MKRFLLLSFACILLLCACNTGRDLPLESTEDINSTPTESSEGALLETSSESSGEESSRHDESLDESQPDEPEEAPCLIVAGVLVTEENASDVFGDHTVRAEFDLENDVVSVYLNDADIDAMTNPQSESPESINGIYCNKTLMLYLEGDNSISVEVPDIDYFYCFGIRTDYSDSIYVYGNGALSVHTSGKGSAYEVVGIETGYLGVFCKSLDIDISGKGSVVGIYSHNGIDVGHHEHLPELTVNAESASTEEPAFGIQADKISASRGIIDVRGYSPAHESVYAGTTTSSYMMTYWDAPQIHADHDGEVILRGNASVCYGNYFTLRESIFAYDSETYYSTQRVYVADSESGKGAYEAEIIHDECPDAFNKPYVKITEGARDDYGVWVCGKRITANNASDVLGDGTVSYDFLSNTLTLNGAIINGGGFVDNHFSNREAVIFAADSLNIKIIGNNLLKCTSDNAVNSCVISVNGILRISGDGQLELRASQGNGTFGTSEAIACDGYDQRGGRITAVAAATPDNTAYGGSIAVCVSTDYFYFNGGTLYAECINGESCYPISIAGSEFDLESLSNGSIEKRETDEKKYLKLTWFS